MGTPRRPDQPLKKKAEKTKREPEQPTSKAAETETEEDGESVFTRASRASSTAMEEDFEDAVPAAKSEPKRTRRGSAASPEMEEAAKNREANKVSTKGEAEMIEFQEYLADIRNEAKECQDELTRSFKLVGGKVELGQPIFERTVKMLNDLTTRFSEDGEVIYENKGELVVVKG